MNIPGYDRWKLASPPEYEMSSEEEAECERCAWENRIDELMNEDETPEILAEIGRLRELLATEPCPACNVEWADQYRGHCDVCDSTGRVRKVGELNGPSEAEIARTQNMIGAILGPDADDDEPRF